MRGEQLVLVLEEGGQLAHDLKEWVGDTIGGRDYGRIDYCIS